MTTLPIHPLSRPSDLAGQSNGRLDEQLLVPIQNGRGRLHHLAARAWQALEAAARAEADLPLTFTFGGTYRTYQSQETLFRSRYDPAGTGGGCKTWNGQLWCKKSANLATAAVPGTSNHGWGLAVDTAYDNDPSDGIGPDDATAITAHPGWPWLLANAARFGWSWELQSEPWHIRYVAGDQLPQAVVDFETPPPPPPPPETPAPDPTVEVDMIVLDWNPLPNPLWTAFVTTGTHLSHLVNGNADQVLRNAGVQRVTVTDEQLLAFIQSTTQTSPPPTTLTPAMRMAWG